MSKVLVDTNGKVIVLNNKPIEGNEGSGDTGYKLYIKYVSGYADNGYIKINDDEPYIMMDYEYIMPSRSSITYNYNQVNSGVTKIKMWGFWHAGTYPTDSSSWARYKLHNGNEWTNISLTYSENDATEITLTGDTDLQIFQGSCLDENTLITMYDGSKKPLREIRVGDEVLGYNNSKQIVVRDEYKWNAYNDYRDVWKFENDYQIITTFQHRFYNVENQKFMYLQEWKIGEHAITNDGIELALLEHIHEDNVAIKYASLWTTDNNYYANGLLAGNRHSVEVRTNENIK